MTGKELCAKCKGRCCKVMSGQATADQFCAPYKELLEACVQEALESGQWVVDWWDADPPVYYLRPRHKGTQGLRDPSWGGECIFLTDTGCELSFPERPTACQLLMPKEDGCVKGISKYDAAATWLPYQKQIMLALNKLGE